jgi:hypothetical protein
MCGIDDQNWPFHMAHRVTIEAVLQIGGRGSAIHPDGPAHIPFSQVDIYPVIQHVQLIPVWHIDCVGQTGRLAFQKSGVVFSASGEIGAGKVGQQALDQWLEDLLPRQITEVLKRGCIVGRVIQQLKEFFQTGI